MSSSRRQILYVSSARRSRGEPHDFHILLGNDVLRARRGFRSRLAISEATVNRSWYNVKEDSRTLTLRAPPAGPNLLLSIPVGSYNALDLRVALAAALPPTGWQVTYNRLSSKYTITRPADATTIYMLDVLSLGPLLGFPAFSTVMFSQSIPAVTSPQPARVNSENSLLIHTDLTKAGGAVLDNLVNVDQFSDSTVLAKIPIDAPPNDNVIFRMQNDLEFVQLPHGHTDALRLWVTDENNVPLALSFDWTCTLVITHDPDEDTALLETLQESRDLLKLMALSNKSVLA
jgi:hypothetical protein